MRSLLLHSLLPTLCALALPTCALAAPSASDAEGVWMNPRKTVAIHTEPCGQSLCGRIAWSSAQARADARDSGIQRLIGTQILENYHFKGGGVWTGTIFVPDMGRKFSSEIDQISGNEMKVKGCILGGLICKSQVWTRIYQIPA